MYILIFIFIDTCKHECGIAGERGVTGEGALDDAAFSGLEADTAAEEELRIDEETDAPLELPREKKEDHDADNDSEEQYLVDRGAGVWWWLYFSHLGFAGN